MMGIGPQTSVRRSFGLFRRKRVGQVELPTTVEADLVCATFYRKYAAQVTVPAAKEKPKDPYK